MSTACQAYELQIENAQGALKTLENRIKEVKSKLDENPDDATYRREMKQLNLDMKITMNELEHAQNELEVCLSRKKQPTSKRHTL